MDSVASSGRSVHELDLGVAQRQAFGASYEKPIDLDDRLEAYQAGKLILPPQPVWQGDPTDWTADPFKDKNWRFQHHTLRWLNPLRWAALAGDEEARAEWVRVVNSWAESNVPASKTKSDFAWRDMADGNRAIQLSLGAPLVGSEDRWYVGLLEYHRDWLMDPDHIVGRNHGLHQHSGLLVVGAVLRDRTAVETAVSRMRDQFESTFDSQGTNDEGSSLYHQHNIVWWSQAWDRAQNEGMTVPVAVAERLESAGNVLAHIAMPNGQLPQIGESARGKVRSGLSDVTDFVASEGHKGKAPEEDTLILDRGYISSRSGWGQTRPLVEESHALIRYGEELRAHSHYDRGSLHIYAGGQQWLIDSGFHSYHSVAPENRYLKSREAHNVASIIGRKHDNTAPVELAASRVTDEYHDFALIDRGYGDDELSRRIVYFVKADCWIVSDRVSSEDDVQVSQNWFVEPGTIARVRDNGFRLSGRESRSFGIHWLGRGTHLSMKRASDESLEAWVGTKWRTLEPGTRLTAKSQKGNAHLVTLLASNSPIPLSIVESRVSMKDNIYIHVARGTAHWQITIRSDEIIVQESSF